ncbi:unnamed protein product [Caenorhabditis nigoni]
MVDIALISKHIPKVFGTLAFIVNSIFVYLIFTEKTTKLGNYRYVLLYFATFNVGYSVVNVMIPIDIHNYRYCFYLFLSDGLFVERSDFHLHLLALRCAVVASSYGVLLSHFIYRYLVVHDSTLTRENFHFFVLISFGFLVAYTSVWHFVGFLINRANTPLPAQPINYVEVIALGAFAFCDPVAIVMCLPIFRNRVLCKKEVEKKRKVVYEPTTVKDTNDTKF